MNRVDYVDHFTMAGAIPSVSAQRWARTVTEDVLGHRAQFVWRVLLGLRLRSAPERIAGWRVADRAEDLVRLEADSWFLTANVVVRTDDRHVSMVTLIRYDRAVAARAWPPLSVLHRRAVPGALRQAYRVLRSTVT